ncbi:MAG: right-handed parallel beta-helix repeat-containing protein [Fimbriimonas sp.]
MPELFDDASVAKAFYVNPAHPGAGAANSGTSESEPFATIGQALAVAGAGDTVWVAPGIYRETVAPQRGGREGALLTLRSSVPGQAIVRGSEAMPAPLTTPGVHFVEIPGDWIKDRNPFAMPVNGSRPGGTCGQVFIGGRPVREVTKREHVERLPGTWIAIDQGRRLLVNLPEAWLGDDWELSIRDRLFAPVDRGLGFIDVLGFTFEHCANQSAAAFWEPANRQCGAVGFRAGHHIRFIGNTVRHAKTIGMDIGIEGGADNGLRAGATDGIIPRDNLIEGNTITDNGEVGACGIHSLRTVVRNNRVERNAWLTLNTVEEAGLKFHMFYDGVIEGNLIRDNEAAGIWLDASWEGSRISRNLVVNNVASGIFVELGDNGCTVDHNIVAYTRLGDGIYTHDTSQVLIAHNLFFGNAHFGVYMRVVTDRWFQRLDGTRPISSCSYNRVLNNLFVDNYRGPICAPANSNISRDNVIDHNHYLSGTQWQWEGLGFNRFCLGDNDGMLSAESVREQAQATGATWSESAYLTFAQWQKLGYDANSHAPSAFRITKENGAVTKGSAALGARDMFFELRLSAEATSPKVAVLENCDTDWNGQQREATTSPGPFAVLEAGHHVLSISPPVA